MVPEHLRSVGALKLHIRKDADLAGRFFAHDISRVLKDFRDNKKRDVLFLASGGSALSVLDHLDKNVIGPYLTIGMFDERFDPTNKTSNYAQLRKTDFYTLAVRRGCRLIDTTTQPGQESGELALYYEAELRRWVAEHPDGAIVATVGMGPDGHTAGIMPFPDDPERFRALFEGKRWVVAYDASGRSPFPERVTTTCTFLRKVDFVGFYITGAPKGPVFRRLIEGDDLAALPASIIKTLPHGAVYADAALLLAAGFTLPEKLA